MSKLSEVGADVFVALDTPDLRSALEIVDDFKQFKVGYKVGLELLTAVGLPQVVKSILVIKPNAIIFADLKLKDIPNTVAGAVRALPPGVAITNLHASGGVAMMQAAAAAAKEKTAYLFAVTVLTSMSDEESRVSYGASTAAGNVVRLAIMAERAGCDGIICSPKDLTTLRGNVSTDLMRLTPGVRPAWAAANDQKRFTTPAQAVVLGADGIVIGRPVTNPPDGMTRAQALSRVLDEMRLIRLFQEFDGLLQGHFVLKSGKHSNEYLNKNVLFPHDHVMKEVAAILSRLSYTMNPGVIVGPETGGAKLAKAMSDYCGTPWVPAKKTPDDDFVVEFPDRLRGKSVLLVEDILTTGGSIIKVKNVLEKMGNKIVGILGLINRGGVKLEGLQTIASLDVTTWEANDCPLCLNAVPINTNVGHAK